MFLMNVGKNQKRCHDPSKSVDPLECVATSGVRNQVLRNSSQSAGPISLDLQAISIDSKILIARFFVKFWYC